MKCRHSSVTLCGRFDPDAGEFVAYQCDDCGAILDREVTADDLERLGLPPLDMNAAGAAIHANVLRAFPATVETVAVDFFAKAIKR